MARHTKIWKVEEDGRDKGKSFLITEMASSKGERWRTGRSWLSLTTTFNCRMDLSVPAWPVWLKWACKVSRVCRGISLSPCCSK